LHSKAFFIPSFWKRHEHYKKRDEHLCRPPIKSDTIGIWQVYSKEISKQLIFCTWWKLNVFSLNSFPGYTPNIHSIMTNNMTALIRGLFCTCRGRWGCMKRKIVWGKVQHSCYFSAKTSLKFVSTTKKGRVSFCPVFHTAPFSPTCTCTL
jgi:hypothetical protein